MFDLLSVAVNTYSGFGMPIGLNWIGNIIKALIDGCGSIGLGIIVFTLILKLITLPFDIISRVSTKKNSLKMEKMRPQLEKLQRQYANDKLLYNQKVQALQKKEGYSMFATCLPTIITIVIFFVVINQFTSYSRNTNLTMINNMSAAYTNAVVEYAENNPDDLVIVTDTSGNKTIEINTELFNGDYFKDLRDGGVRMVKVEGSNTEADYYTVDINSLARLIEAYNANGYTYYVAAEKFTKNGDTYEINYESGWDRPAIEYQVKSKKAQKAGAPSAIDEFTASQEEIDEMINSIMTTNLVNYKYTSYVNDNVKKVGRAAAAEYYRSNAPKFLWVKNLWVPDLPWKHPVFEKLSDYDFYNNLDEANKAKQAEFEEITYDLQQEKTDPNGYLILVVLSIGIMFLSQFIMTKTQKAQMELQSVDGQQGQAAMTSKMMMWMMPIMFGVFAFIYTASFSIYMIISSVISTLSTVIINFFVERSFKKKAELEEAENDKRFSRG